MFIIYENKNKEIMENDVTRIKNLIQKKFAGKSDNFLKTYIFETDMVVSLSVRAFVEKLFKLDKLLNMLYQIDDVLFTAEYVLDSNNEKDENLPYLRLKRLDNEVSIRCNLFGGNAFDVITSSKVYYAGNEKEVLTILSLMFF